MAARIHTHSDQAGRQAGARGLHLPQALLMGHEVADCGNKAGSQTLCCPGVQRPRLGMQTGNLGQRHPKGHDGLDQCSARAEYPSQWVHSALADGPIPAWVSQCSPCPIPLWGCGSRHLPRPHTLPLPTVMGGEGSRSNSPPPPEAQRDTLILCPPHPSSGEPRLGGQGPGDSGHPG